MPYSMMRWDIFCKVVDNFGDIGVCWRLARQLQTEHQLQVRLLVDDLTVARQLIPQLDVALQTQVIQNISIVVWHETTVFSDAAGVVIESFGCELPPAYLAHMQPDTAWVNLEYLSAESWVEDFHARNSRRGNLTRHFFFPGFTAATGGLLREHDIVASNRQMADSKLLQQQFLQRLGLREDKTLHEAWQDNNRLKISLFCYPHAPIHALLDAMASSDQRIDCYVPASSILPAVAGYFGSPSLAAGDALAKGNLSLHVLPFLSQADYDKLLATCDINFVRGEDSWIRAIWAGKPFIWQPYRQTENTHITKLNAFLDTYYSGCDAAARKSAYEMHAAWVADNIATATWQSYLSNLAVLESYIAQQTDAFAAQTDLATKLVIFIENLQSNEV